MKVVPTKSTLERGIESTSNHEIKNLDWAFRPLHNWINCILGLKVPLLRILIYAINLLIHVSLYLCFFYYKEPKSSNPAQMNKDPLQSNKNNNNSDYSNRNTDEMTSTFSWNVAVDYANFTCHSVGIHTILVVGSRFKRRWETLWISINGLEVGDLTFKKNMTSLKMVTEFRRISIRWLIYIIASV